ncbi:MAG TPA: sigma-54-dependent Fis family transcriptional regulator [Chondromyces sp.]|nr:sigma-54-dependent Fis family transcriptional regulator [Chondromyces sp.]
MTSEMIRKQTWMDFVQEGSLDDRILPNEIIHSWQRCKRYNVNPLDGVSNKVLTRDDFEKKIRQNQLLLNLTKQSLPRLHKFLKGWHYITVLTDRDGCILFKTGESAVEKSAERISFKEGAMWGEEEVGTNAIGLAKRLKKSIAVNGYEHFAVASQSWNCFAAPILNQDHELIGVLNISSMCSPINKNYVLSSVQLAADTISLAWKKQVQEDNELLLKYDLLDSPSIICTLDKTICSLSTQLIPDYQWLIGHPLTSVDEGDLKLSKTLIPIMNESRIIGYRIPILEERERFQKLKFNGVKGKSRQYHRMLEDVEKVAPTEAAVHIFGETGTGKELIAEAIHHNSHRSSGPFIKLNCGAIPEQLLESEIFGYEPGAFTGADRKGYKGKFEQADGGTLFLDEVADIPHSMQKALLRVLQQKELTRLGGTAVKKVNVRLITAANIDIRDLVKQGKMREDFFYRIYVYPIHIPPLRSRKEDIENLIEAYFQKEQWLPSWHRRLISMFKKGQWHGNVRELQNALERCKIRYANKVPTDNELLQLMSSTESISPTAAGFETHDFRTELEIREIKEALKKCKGHISNTAKELNISRATLYRKMKKYHLS